MGRSARRREILSGGFSLVVTAAFAGAEPSRAPRVALLTSGRGSVIHEWFRDAFRGLGYEEGKNLVLDFREANGRYADLPQLVAELIALKPDVLIAEATPAVAAAQRATSTIPIVMSPATNPIGSGFVKSFAHPGGNITGVANMFGDLTAKTLDIIRLVFPGTRSICVLTSNNPTHPGLFEVAKQAAAAVGISAARFTAATPDDLDSTFADMKAARCDAVYVLADPVRPALPSIALGPDCRRSTRLTPIPRPAA